MAINAIIASTRCSYRARRRLCALLILIFVVCKPPSTVSCSRTSAAAAYFVSLRHSRSQSKPSSNISQQSVQPLRQRQSVFPYVDVTDNLKQPQNSAPQDDFKMSKKKNQRRLGRRFGSTTLDSKIHRYSKMERTMRKDTSEKKRLDRFLQHEHPKQEKAGAVDGSEKKRRWPPSFQMLPRNTKPPHRGPSPGSNGLGN